VTEGLLELTRQYRDKWGREANLTEFSEYLPEKTKVLVLRHILQTGQNVHDGFNECRNKIWTYIEKEGYGGSRPDGVILSTPCPFCGGKVIYHKFSETAWGYECQTDRCMKDVFRGL